MNTTECVKIPEAVLISNALSQGPAVREQAWECLIYRFRRLIWTCIRKYRFSEIDAEEVFQDVVLKLFMKLDTFDPAIAPLAPWIIRISINTAKDRLRGLIREAERRDPGGEELLPSHPAEDWQSALILEHDVETGLEVVATPIQREMLTLRKAGYSYTEIADKLGTTKDQIRNGLCTVRKQLKEWLHQEDFAPQS